MNNMESMLLYSCPEQMELKENVNSKYYSLNYVLFIIAIYIFLYFCFVLKQKKGPKILD